MMNRLSFFLILMVAALGFAARISPESTTLSKPLALTGEKLIVFTQEQDQHFRSSCLPRLQEWTKMEGIELIERSAAEGVPTEITATPAIVFQNDRGRAIYASRYAELGTIKNFVRTNRLRPQANQTFCTDQVLQLKNGRASLNAPVKLTALTGELPESWSEAAFRQAALDNIAQGMNEYEAQDEACLARTDRAFYCDFHPYRSEDGMLYLSLELYSMFNCIRPVFTTGETALSGSFEDYATVFQAAGSLLQEMITRQVQQSEIGDAWSPLTDDITVVDWEGFGLALPENVATATPSRTDYTVAQQWSGTVPVVPGVPALFFRFMEPLDRYAGEVPDFNGQLSLDSEGRIRSGEFSAELKSLTMGMAELDDKVKKKYIYTRRFPEASFSFDLSEDQAVLLQAGQLNRVPVEGTFTFMKQEKQMKVQAELTPELLESGKQQMMVHVQFDLNVTDDYGIAGPDGPDPARKTMIFDLNFIMSPQ